MSNGSGGRLSDTWAMIIIAYDTYCWSSGPAIGGLR